MFIHCKSHLLIRDQRNKRRKLEELKDLELTNYDLDIANTHLQQEIENLKYQVIKYKDRINESLKYKDIIQKLIDEGKLNELWEEKIWILIVLIRIQHNWRVIKSMIESNHSINIKVKLIYIDLTKLYNMNYW